MFKDLGKVPQNPNAKRKYNLRFAECDCGETFTVSPAKMKKAIETGTNIYCKKSCKGVKKRKVLIYPKVKDKIEHVELSREERDKLFWRGLGIE